jgi:hypothetical protein
MFHYHPSITICIDNQESDQAAQELAMRAYQTYLSTLDLSSAGDLLLYFGLDFFHDAMIEDIHLDHNKRDITIQLRQWIEGEFSPEEKLPEEMVFSITFIDVAWFLIQPEVDERGLQQFLYAEIDGLDEQRSAIGIKNGKDVHSLTIKCDAGWIALVFRAVRVTSEDPITWTRILRHPKAKLYLYGQVL